MGMLRAVLLAESVLVLLVLLPALPQAEAAKALKVVHDPDHPGTCFIEERGIRVKVGYTWQLPGCGRATCTSSPAYGMVIDYASCGTIGAPIGCRVQRDMTKPYPQCCGKIYCPPAY